MAHNLDLYQPPTQPLSAERFTQGAIGTLLSAHPFIERPNGSNLALNAACFALELGVLIGVGGPTGADPYIVTSEDSSLSWTTRTPAATHNNVDLFAVAWNGTMAVAVGDTDGSTGIIYTATAPNGTGWTRRTPGTAKNVALRGVAWSSTLTLWVAVGDDDGTRPGIYTSPDGITWTLQPPPAAAFDLNAVAWNGTAFVAVGDATGTRALIQTSTNGTTWTTQDYTSPKNFGLLAIAWSARLALWIAGGAADGSDGYLLTSADYVTWTERANPVNFAINGIVETGALMLFCGAADGTRPYIGKSSNGTAWTQLTTYAPGHAAKNFALNGLCFTGAMVMMVGAADGTDAYLLSILHHFELPYRGQTQAAAQPVLGSQHGADVAVSNLLELYDFLHTNGLGGTLADADATVVVPRGGARYVITPTAARTLTFNASACAINDPVEVTALGTAGYVIAKSSDADVIDSYVKDRVLALRTKQAAPTDKTHWAFRDNGPVMLERQTLSAAATCDFIYGIDGIGEQYEIRFRLLPATDAVNLYVLVSIDGGVTFTVGVSDYRWAIESRLLDGTGTLKTEFDAADSEFQTVISGFNLIGNLATEGVRGVLKVLAPFVGNHIG